MSARPSTWPRKGTLTAPLFRWLVVVAAVTLILWILRPWLDEAHMALAYLLVVLGASARHGGRLGFALALGCFLAFNFFLLPPLYTLALADPLDWLVLFAFMVTAAVAAHLLDRSRAQAELAEERADEIDRLSALGAETLNAPRAEVAVEAIARVMRMTAGVDLCEIFLWNSAEARFLRVGRDPGESENTEDRASDELLRYVAEQGVAATERADGTTHLAGDREASVELILVANPDARALLLPLRIRDRTVGVLRLAGAGASGVDAEAARMAAVLSFYAALAVERVRLSIEEERARALSEADTLKDAFIASVSHDLRTPLTKIRALASELRAGGDERLAAIEAEADRLNRMVGDVLDLSRVRANALPLNIEVNSAEDLLGAALAQVSASPGSAAIRAHIADGKRVIVGRFDFVHALRALTNLIDNALRYGGGRPVEVEVRRVDDRLVFEVKDRGPGIATEALPHLFEPFHASLDGRDGGTRLGLVTSRRITEAQGGTIRYVPREGGGSVFLLELPATDVPDFIE